MSTEVQPSVTNPKIMTWAGLALSVLSALMLIMSSTPKLTQSKDAIEGFKHLGYPDGIALTIGIVELACAIIYLVPQTAVLGAILLTGYMGGTIATHVRLSEPFYVQFLIGVVIWLGLYLRDPRIRALIPLRR